MTSFSSVHIYVYCISSASERNCMHFLVILSRKTLWAGVKHWRTALHRFYVYRKPISSPWSRNLKVIQKCVHLKCICVWCTTDLGFCQVSLLYHIFYGKVKNIAISSDPLSPFHCHACISYLFHHFFPMICDWGSPSFLCHPITGPCHYPRKYTINVLFIHW